MTNRPGERCMRNVTGTLPLFLAGWLLVSQMGVCAQSPLTPSPSAANNSATQPLKASEVLLHARELYANEGARAARPEFEKALALFRKEGDRKGEAITLGLIGNCYKRFGEFPKALDYLQRALSLKQQIGDRGEEGKTLSHLGLLYRDMSQYPRAIEYFKKAIAVGSQLKDRILEASSRNNLGLVYDDLGEYRLALEEYNLALQLYRGTDFARGISDTIGNIGGEHLLLGEYSEALRYYRESLEIDERGKLTTGISQDLENIGLCYIGLGRAPEAIVSSSSTVVHAVSVIQISSQASTIFGDSGNSNPDFDFRYDASLGGYVYNLKTTGFGTGSYLLNFIAGNSPTGYSVGFQVRQ
jgi:tetratricopeptide (TPR) repeat protein